MHRRSFLKNSLVATGTLSVGAGLPGESLTLAQGVKSSSDRASLQSTYLTLEYDLARGTANLHTAKSASLFLNATSAVSFPRTLSLASDSNYVRSSRRATSTDPGVEGEQLDVTCNDTNKTLNLECRFTLLRDRPGAVLELIATNVSKKEVIIDHSEPLRALLAEKSGCFFGAEGSYSRVQKVLTNGYLYSDPGEVVEIASQGRRDVSSLWNAAFYAGSDEILVVGYLENRQAEGKVVAGWDMSRPWRDGQCAFDLTAQSLYNRTFVLKPGGSVSSGRLLVLLSSDPFSGLEYYAETYARLHRVKLNPIINGWCSWFYTQTQATEEEQLKNAEFIAKDLKPYGMEWVQIDDGYQRSFGNWEGNQLYPHGMKWLAGEIRKLGLKPGIWIAPYAISADSDVAQKHPDWLAHYADGKVQSTASSRAKYILDITHTEAREWLKQLFETLVHEWGYDFIKIDFVEWTLLAIERYYDPTVSRAQAYRLGFEVMRSVMGPNRHLLDCGPAPETVGLLDSVRIEQDLPHLTWEQYAKHQSSNAPAAAKRYYFHNRTWINDADHLGLALLTVPQSQAAASIIALSGGTVISGDRLDQLESARLEILKKVLPSYGQAARPLDLFEKSFPEIFALKIDKDFGQWWLIGYFNWDEGAQVVRDCEFSRLGLPPQKHYLVYEFWTQRLLADVVAKSTLTFEPSSVNLIAVHERRGVPQLLGTDRHFTQGGLELENVRWDGSQRTLSGTGLGAPGLSWNLAIYVPDTFSWDESRPDLFRDYPNVSAVSHEKNVLRARLNFGTDRVNWSFKFKRSRSS